MSVEENEILLVANGIGIREVIAPEDIRGGSDVVCVVHKTALINVFVGHLGGEEAVGKLIVHLRISN